MPISNIEEAKEYSDKVHRHLMDLAKLSKDAGLMSHTAIWYGIAAAFMESTDEIETIIEMMKMYLHKKMEVDRESLREELYPNKE